MTGAGHPAIDHLAHGILPGRDVLADLLAAVAGQLRPVTRRAAIAVLVIEVVVVGHRARVSLGRCGQRGVPGQWRGGGKGLRTALACPAAGNIEFGQQLLTFRLPIAEAPAQQRTGEHDAPFTVLAAHADVDELRVQHHLAETLANRRHGRLRITGTGQADRLHIDHRIPRRGQCLLQIAEAGGGQRQPWIARQRWQLR